MKQILNKNQHKIIESIKFDVSDDFKEKISNLNNISKLDKEDVGKSLNDIINILDKGIVDNDTIKKRLRSNEYKLTFKGDYVVLFYKENNKVRKLKIKLGKFIRLILPQTPDHIISTIVDKWKVGNIDTITHKIIKGDEIASIYNKNEDYMGGALKSSCMTGLPKEFFKLYTENNSISLLVVEDGGKIVSRSLIWETNVGKVMDKIYSSKDKYLEYVKSLIKQKSYLTYKDLETINKPVIVKLENVNYNHYPFLDTFQYLNLTKKQLSDTIKDLNYDPNDSIIMLDSQKGYWTVYQNYKEPYIEIDLNMVINKPTYELAIILNLAIERETLIDVISDRLSVVLSDENNIDDLYNDYKYKFYLDNIDRYVDELPSDLKILTSDNIFNLFENDFEIRKKIIKLIEEKDLKENSFNQLLFTNFSNYTINSLFNLLPISIEEANLKINKKLKKLYKTNINFYNKVINNFFDSI